MTTAEEFMLDLRAAAGKISGIHLEIAQVEDNIANDRRALKRRRNQILLAGTRSKDKNPEITGSNEVIRKAQHEACCNEDHEMIRLRGAIDIREATLRRLRVDYAKHKRSYAIAEQALATYRAELNARATEFFGTMIATTNGDNAKNEETAVPGQAAVSEGR